MSNEILAPRAVSVIPSTSDAGVVNTFIAPFDGEVVALRATNGAALASHATSNQTFTLKKIPVKASDGTADTAVTIGTVGGVNKAWVANVALEGSLSTVAGATKFKKGDLLTVTTALVVYTSTTPLFEFAFIAGYSK